MTHASPIQTNFTAGEISPRLYGRVDLAKYANGAKQIVNAIVQPHGGATRRPGTRFVAAARYGDREVRLLPFRFNADQAYILEVGDRYIRFYADEGRIEAPAIANLVTNGDFTGDIAGWTDASSGGGISHDAAAGRLSFDVSLAGHKARAEQDVAGDLAVGAQALVRFEVSGLPGETITLYERTASDWDKLGDYGVGHHIVAVAETPGGASGTFGIAFEKDGAVRPTPAQLDNVAVVTGAVEIASPWPEEALFALKFAQSADTLYIAHPDYPPMKLLRRAHDEWSLERVEFADGPWLDGNAGPVTLTLSHTSGFNRTLTASEDLFDAGDVGRPVRIQHTNEWGWAVIADVLSATAATIHIFGDFNGTAAVKTWRLGAWSDRTGWPACVTFHEQRLCWAGEKSSPQAFRASKSSDFQNMSPSETDGAVFDDHALNYVIGANQVNAIRWLSSTRSLLLGTTGGTWPVRANSLDDPLTPANIQIKRANTFGSADLQPLDVGDVVLYASPAGRKLRELGYFFERDNFAAPDVSILAEHITEGGIRQIDFAQEPNGVVFAVRGDGVLLGMTYEREQNVIAWQRHVLGGSHAGGAAKTESVAVVPSPATGESQVWLVVRRTVGGVEVRHVEFMSTGAGSEGTVEDAYFVDCGLSYDDPRKISAATATDPVVLTVPDHGFANGDLVDIEAVAGMAEINGRRFAVEAATADTFALSDEDGGGHTAYAGGGVVRRAVSAISGLDHLEGETVDLLADGHVLAPAVVSGGSVSLAYPASRVHAGYGYVSDIETLNMEAGGIDGTAQGKTRRIHHVVLRLFRSRGVFVGPDLSRLEALPFPVAPDGSPPTLFSGDIEVAFAGGFDTEATVLVRQSQPLPMTLLAIMPRLDTAAR